MPATRNKGNPESQRRAIRREYNATKEDDSFRAFFAQRGLDILQPATGLSRTAIAPSTSHISSTAVTDSPCTAPASSRDTNIELVEVVGESGDVTGDWPELAEGTTECCSNTGTYEQFMGGAGASNDILEPFDDILLQQYANPITLDEIIPPSEEITSALNSDIPDIENIGQFIESLKSAQLDDSKMSPEDIARLREAPSTFPFDVHEPDFIFSLRSFLSVTNASQETYDSFRRAALARHPEDKFYSFHQMKRRVEQISGVVPITHDMCINSCIAFTGPFAALDQCSICSELRYERIPGQSKHHARRQFHTIPIGPVIQALYRSPESARQMHHRRQRTDEILRKYQLTKVIDVYDDVYTGSDYLRAVLTGNIEPDDVMLQLSIDGAQLFRNKESDCWIYIYIIHNLPPDVRYKKNFVIPGSFIPGPNAPKHTESFMFPGLYHLSALQNEGLMIWDASCNKHFRSIPFMALGTADSPAMADLSGMVGHQGKFGCRLYCGLPGRRRPREGCYYPVLLKPHNFAVDGCDHEDISFQDLKQYRSDITQRYKDNLVFLCQATTPHQFKERRLMTGLCKPTIFSGLRKTLGIPNLFVLDIMHLVALNDPDLLLGLWRGVIQTYGNDNYGKWEWFKLGKGPVWTAHGKTVAMATPFIPSSFDRAPHNPAEKINSGYKAWEYLLYFFGLGPALLQPILPISHWKNYCKLVRGIQILQQRSIPRDQLINGTKLLYEFEREFEELYYQRSPDRIHFIRQSIHLLTHIGHETTRIGPLACYSQWTMETAIGNLGEEIRQDRDPYANISQRGILRAQLNAIKSMLPELSQKEHKKLPAHSIDLEDGYVLLRACDTALRNVSEPEAQAILTLWTVRQWPNQDGWYNSVKAVKRWARLHLPGGQIARSSWGEARSRRNLRRTTIVKFLHNEKIYFGEVRYYFRLRFGDLVHTLGIVSVFSQPDASLLAESSHTVYACHYRGDNSLMAIDVKQIKAVVAMIPYFRVISNEIQTPETEHFLVEKPYLDITYFRGEEDPDSETEECGEREEHAGQDLIDD